MVSYRVDNDLKIHDAEVLYASEPSQWEASLANLEDGVVFHPGKYQVFNWRINAAPRRTGRPDLQSFREKLTEQLKDSDLPTEGFLAVRLAFDETGKISDSQTLVSEPEELQEMISPYLTDYASFANSPPGQLFVEALTIGVQGGEIGGINVTKGFLFPTPDS